MEAYSAVRDTDGTTAQDFELVVCLAEKRSHAYPVALLALRPSKSRIVGSKVNVQSRLRVITSFFDVIRSRQNVQPRVVHVDKDFSEISAIRQVWPTSSIHICLWHMKKAVERGLAQPPTEKGTLYNPEEVAHFLSSVSRNFLPLNPKAPKRTLVDPYHTLPNPVISPSPIPTPAAPASPTPLSPLSQFRSFMGNFIPAPPPPPLLDDEEASERRRLEYDDEDEEEPWELPFAEMNGGLNESNESRPKESEHVYPVEADESISMNEGITAEERRDRSQRKFREDVSFQILADFLSRLRTLVNLSVTDPSFGFDR